MNKRASYSEAEAAGGWHFHPASWAGDICKEGATLVPVPFGLSEGCIPHWPAVPRRLLPPGRHYFRPTHEQEPLFVVGLSRNFQEIDHHPIGTCKQSLRGIDHCFQCFLVQRGCIKLSHSRKCLFPTSTVRLCLQVLLVIQSEQLQVISCHPTWVSENYLH